MDDYDYKSIDCDLGRHAMALAEREWGSVPQPLNAYLDSPAMDPERSCKSLGDWYVVSIERQRAKLAKAEIASRGAVPYLPLIPKHERHGRGAIRTVWRPLFGPYLFVRCLPWQWGMVMACRGVRRFLGMDSTPKAVAPGCIEAIRLIEAEATEAERECEILEMEAAKARAGGRSGIIWHFSAGDRVRIKAGPFAGFYTELTNTVDVHDRIKLLVSLFGHPTVTELSAFDIEKAL